MCSVVVVSEADQRSLQTDLLLALLKKVIPALLQSNLSGRRQYMPIAYICRLLTADCVARDTETVELCTVETFDPCVNNSIVEMW